MLICFDLVIRNWIATKQNFITFHMWLKIACEMGPRSLRQPKSEESNVGWHNSVRYPNSVAFLNASFVTVGELRSTENARCTIMIRFVYEYATLYFLHATTYVRMIRSIYDPKRVSCINYTIFPRYLEKNSSFSTYLSKLIIDIVLLQPPNTMYLPGIEVSDDIVSLCGDGPAWKCPDAELLHHTTFQIKFIRMQTL